jgi:hypothetical protein
MEVAEASRARDAFLRLPGLSGMSFAHTGVCDMIQPKPPKTSNNTIPRALGALGRLSPNMLDLHFMLAGLAATGRSLSPTVATGPGLALCRSTRSGTENAK